jgi:hypothetical protein
MNNALLTGNPGTGPYASLNQLLLASVSVVFREDKMQMQCKNKQQRQALWAKQLLISPWTWYQGMMGTIDPTNHASCPPHLNSMCLTGCVSQHPDATLLQEWATYGCLMKTGKPWSKTKCGRQLPGVHIAWHSFQRQSRILLLKLWRRY